MCFALQRRAICFGPPNFKKCSEPYMFCIFSLANVLRATAACNLFWTSEPQKVLGTLHVLYILTSKCASRYSDVQFFNIRTSKSASELACFVHFDLKMCFSPQRRAIFRHQNFKKCSGADVFCTFWLQNVLFAPAACNFWFRCWAPTSAPAALSGLLFDWPDTRIIEKTLHFATSLTFGADVSSFFWLSRYCIFFLLTWLLYSAFQKSILSEVRLLNFLRWYIYIYLCRYILYIQTLKIAKPIDPRSRSPGAPRMLPVTRPCGAKLLGFASRTTARTTVQVARWYIIAFLLGGSSHSHSGSCGFPVGKFRDI